MLFTRIHCVNAAVAVVLLVALTGRASAAFVNEGFETGDLAGWTVTTTAPHGVATEGTLIAGSPIPGNYVHPAAGDYAVWALLQPSGDGSTISFSQTVNVEAGVRYEFGFKAGVFASSGAPSFDMTRQWVIDGVERPVLPSLGNSWITASLAHGPFADGAHQVTYTLNLGRAPQWATGAQGITIDDIYLREVPEPSAAAGTMALAASFALRRKRRRPATSSSAK